jgi:hypothetical protein
VRDLVQRPSGSHNKVEIDAPLPRAAPVMPQVMTNLIENVGWGRCLSQKSPPHSALDATANAV